jgi:hypothetical protein
VEAKGGPAWEEEGGAGKDSDLSDKGGGGGLRSGSVGALGWSRIVVSHPFRKEREKDGKPKLFGLGKEWKTRSAMFGIQDFL